MAKLCYLVIVQSMYGFRYREGRVCAGGVGFGKFDIEVKADVCAFLMAHCDIEFWTSDSALGHNWTVKMVLLLRRTFQALGGGINL